MNDDAFEKKLRERIGVVQRPDPTRAWKADILARARREADAIPHERLLPPRWFIAALGVAWLVIFLMNAATPHDVSPGGMRAVAAVPKASARGGLTDGDSWTLLAFHNRMNLTLDLPQ